MAEVGTVQRWLRVERSQHGYGTRVWLGERVRLGSRRTMTPMRPHIYRGGDEFCNDTLCFHLYPLVAVDVWWRRKQRTAVDGPCSACERELSDLGMAS